MRYRQRQRILWLRDRIWRRALSRGVGRYPRLPLPHCAISRSGGHCDDCPRHGPRLHSDRRSGYSGQVGGAEDFGGWRRKRFIRRVKDRGDCRRNRSLRLRYDFFVTQFKGTRTMPQVPDLAALLRGLY